MAIPEESREGAPSVPIEAVVLPSDLTVEGAPENEVHLCLWLLKVALLVDLAWSRNMVIGLHSVFVRTNLELA